MTPETGTLTCDVTFVKRATAGPMTIVFYEVACRAASGPIMTMTTDFGFFPADALVNQTGLPVTPAHRAQLQAPSAVPPSTLPDMLRQPVGAGMPRDNLAMVDDVAGYWPEGGRARAAAAHPDRQEVKPDSWYFKAHFYEDPVQPGSLGLEALLQALKSYLILSGAGRNLQAPRFEPIALGEALVWKYRGQVVPRNKEVTTCLSVTVTEKDGDVLAVAEGTLWADGLPMYEVKNMAVRIADTAPLAHRITTCTPSRPAWVADHCPTYALPALPMMAFAAEMAAVAYQASGRKVLAIDGLRARRWVPVPDDGVRMIAEARAAGDAYDVTAVACTGGEDRPLMVERHEAATGRVSVGDVWPAAPAPWPALIGAAPAVDPYATSHLFHGPTFHLQRELRRSAAGASAVIEVPASVMPDEDRAVLVLDAALHGVPHDEPELWLGEARGMVAFPEQITALRFYGEFAQGRPPPGRDAGLVHLPPTGRSPSTRRSSATLAWLPRSSSPSASCPRGRSGTGRRTSAVRSSRSDGMSLASACRPTRAARRGLPLPFSGATFCRGRWSASTAPQDRCRSSPP